MQNEFNALSLPKNFQIEAQIIKIIKGFFFSTKQHQTYPIWPSILCQTGLISIAHIRVRSPHFHTLDQPYSPSLAKNWKSLN